MSTKQQRYKEFISSLKCFKIQKPSKLHKFMMEVISDEIKTVTRSQNSIPFNVNFDSLLEKYKEQGIFKLFYNYTLPESLVNVCSIYSVLKSHLVRVS